MLDFVLNLLIFFIITTSFVREAGITVNRAEAETAVHGGEREHPDRDAPERRDLDGPAPGRPARGAAARSSACTSSGPRTPSIVIADKAAKSGLLAQVMDEVKLGGIKEVADRRRKRGGSVRRDDAVRFPIAVLLSGVLIRRALRMHCAR